MWFLGLSAGEGKLCVRAKNIRVAGRASSGPKFACLQVLVLSKL